MLTPKEAREKRAEQERQRLEDQAEAERRMFEFLDAPLNESEQSSLESIESEVNSALLSRGWHKIYHNAARAHVPPGREHGDGVARVQHHLLKACVAAGWEIVREQNEDRHAVHVIIDPEMLASARIAAQAEEQGDEPKTDAEEA